MSPLTSIVSPGRALAIAALIVLHARLGAVHGFKSEPDHAATNHRLAARGFAGTARSETTTAAATRTTRVIGFIPRETEIGRKPGHLTLLTKCNITIANCNDPRPQASSASAARRGPSRARPGA